MSVCRLLLVLDRGSWTDTKEHFLGRTRRWNPVARTHISMKEAFGQMSLERILVRVIHYVNKRDFIEYSPGVDLDPMILQGISLGSAPI